VSGAKGDAGDAHVLADMVRTDAHQLRVAAGDSDLAEGIKVLARAHKKTSSEPLSPSTPAEPGTGDLSA
jgi:hypothetical protein